MTAGGTRELLLVRHGNTFGPGDRVVWVGAGEDLPLVEKGREQARALGHALERLGWTPDAAVSSALVRQREHLEIAAAAEVPRSVDARLGELDYGAWGGRTTDELVAEFGADEVAAWNERSEWPAAGAWPESRGEVHARVRSFADDVARGALGARVLACSSNGLLRWFLELVPGAFEDARIEGRLKVRTGGACLLRFADGAWSVGFWNVAPDGLDAWDG
ncbi:MAG: histidine phosphatase family protein [Planctomycetota bacterium]